MTSQTWIAVGCSTLMLLGGLCSRATAATGSTVGINFDMPTTPAPDADASRSPAPVTVAYFGGTAPESPPDPAASAWTRPRSPTAIVPAPEPERASVAQPVAAAQPTSAPVLMVAKSPARAADGLSFQPDPRPLPASPPASPAIAEPASVNPSPRSRLPVPSLAPISQSAAAPLPPPPVTAAAPPLTPMGGSNATAKPYTTLTELFAGGSESLVARAVGGAEGTRTPDGGRNPAYHGHVDPGNGVWNLGSFSYQHGASSPAAADAKQLERLRGQAQILRQKAAAYNIVLGLEEELNGIDLANQAPMAALDREGYIDRLAQAYQMGLRGTDAVLWARTRAFIDPDTQRWNAPGLGNNIQQITHDQNRRQQAIQKAIAADAIWKQFHRSP